MHWLQSMTGAMRIIFKLESFVKVERHRLLHAHFAPSCGTASKARERLVPGLPKSGNRGSLGRRKNLMALTI